MHRLIIFLLLFLPTHAFADVWTFETPSENVQCAVGQEVNFSDITCTIIKRSGSPALPRPSNCDAEWGHVFFMRDQGSVEMQCSNGKHTKGGFDRAEYGITGKFGGFTCNSSKKGLKCTNKDGNGFFLSRKKQTIIGSVKAAAPSNAIEQKVSVDKEGQLLSVIGKEVASGCSGLGGTFKAKGIIEIDLNSNGVEDLVLAHQNLECNGENVHSNTCGTQVCSIKAYLYSNGSYKFVDEFLGRITGYSWSPELVFEISSQGKIITKWKPNYRGADASGERAKPSNSSNTGKSHGAETPKNTTKLKIPVIERGTNDDLPTCASSIVSTANTNIRSGPGDQYQKIGKLNEAEVVYVFDQRGKWAGVVYRTKNVECSTKKTREVPYKNKGWVRKNLLSDLAG